MAAPGVPTDEERGARIRRTVLLLSVVVAVLYVGTIVLLVWRGHS